MKNEFKAVWDQIVKIEVPKAYYDMSVKRCSKISTLFANLCEREILTKKKIELEQALSKEKKKSTKKIQQEEKKKSDRELLYQRKLELEKKEAERQEKKLNFLLTQTELYAHFMANKMQTQSKVSKVSEQPTIGVSRPSNEHLNNTSQQLDEQLHSQAKGKAEAAVLTQTNQIAAFDQEMAQIKARSKIRNLLVRIILI